MTDTLRIVSLFISPGHNFFGHYGQPASDHPVEAKREVNCVAGWGIEGDRFFGYRPDYKGQVTFFAHEVYDELCGKLGVRDRSPAVFRRNVITRGVDLRELFTREFEVQGVRFQGMGECAPCHWMNQAFGPGAEDALRGRGGLRARVLSSGKLQVDAG